MAVYFAPKQQNYWGRAIADLSTGLLGKLMGDMFERTNQAKEVERNRGLYSQLAQSMSGGTPSRENMLGTFGKYGISPEQAKGFFDFYENQFKNQDDLNKMDAVAGRTTGLNYNTPEQTMQSGSVAQAYGLKPEELLKYAYPNQEAGHFNAGDREVQYSFDPRTGKFGNQEHGYGLNPTDKYTSDMDVQEANIRASASKYVADRNLQGREKGDSGVRPPKPLSITDMKNLDAMVTKAIQISPDIQTLQMYLERIAGDNPEVKEYVNNISSAPKFVKRKAGEDWVVPNPHAGWYTPNEPQSEDFTPQAQEILESTNGDIATAINLVDESNITPEMKKSLKATIGQLGNKKPNAPQAKVFPRSELTGYAKTNGMTKKDALIYLKQQGYEIK